MQWQAIKDYNNPLMYIMDDQLSLTDLDKRINDLLMWRNNIYKVLKR